MIFSQQIISSRLLQVVISGQKSNFVSMFKLELITIFHLWFVVKNVVDVALFLHNNFNFCCCWFQYLYYYLKSFPCVRFSFFWFKKTPTLLCLIRDKIIGYSSKNTTLTRTKISSKKQGHSSVDFQIILFAYKLILKIKIIYKKLKTQFFFFFGYKIGPLKKSSSHV